jgi:hypothetical protein
MDDLFSLTVTVAADEWARAQRRIRYLEAALVQAYRAQRQLKEWFTVAELLALRLPDLPTTRQGVVRRAHAEDWLCRIATGRGGERWEFHFTNLPRKAFEEMIRRIVEPPSDTMDAPISAAPAPHVPEVPPPEPEPVAPGLATAPLWLLPLMRLIRSNPSIHVDSAMTMLDLTLPEDGRHDPPSPPPPALILPSVELGAGAPKWGARVFRCTTFGALFGVVSAPEYGRIPEFMR